MTFIKYFLIIAITAFFNNCNNIQYNRSENYPNNDNRLSSKNKQKVKLEIIKQAKKIMKEISTITDISMIFHNFSSNFAIDDIETFVFGKGLEQEQRELFFKRLAIEHILYNGDIAHNLSINDVKIYRNSSGRLWAKIISSLGILEVIWYVYIEEVEGNMLIKLFEIKSPQGKLFKSIKTEKVKDPLNHENYFNSVSSEFNNLLKEWKKRQSWIKKKKKVIDKK